MPGLWVVSYSSIADKALYDAYSAAAVKALIPFKGEVKCFGPPKSVPEGESCHVVIVEFESLEVAHAAYASEAYAAAMALAAGAFQRTFAICSA